MREKRFCPCCQPKKLRLLSLFGSGKKSRSPNKKRTASRREEKIYSFVSSGSNFLFSLRKRTQNGREKTEERTICGAMRV